MKWVELVQEKPNNGRPGKGSGLIFFQYLKNHTILSHLPKSYFASRPVAREANCNIDTIRAIPFTMCLGQTRDFCVGFYGCGTAFELGTQYLSSVNDTACKLAFIYWNNLKQENLKLEFKKNILSGEKNTNPLISILQLQKIDIESCLKLEVTDVSLKAILSLFPSINDGINQISTLLLDIVLNNTTPLFILQEMLKHYKPFRFSIENKEASLLIHDKKVIDMYTQDASPEEKSVVEDIEEEAQLSKKWILKITEQDQLKIKYAKDTNSGRLFLLHKIQSYFLRIHRNGNFTSKQRVELENNIQLTILAISEALGFGG